MSWKIKNATKKNRYCADVLVKAGEEIMVEKELYLKSASLSPEIFEISQAQKKKEPKGDK